MEESMHRGVMKIVCQVCEDKRRCRNASGGAPAGALCGVADQLRGVTDPLVRRPLLEPASMRGMNRVHSLKSWAGSDSFDGLWTGMKKAEARKFDRDYRVGDCLELREVIANDNGGLARALREAGTGLIPLKETGREIFATVTHVLSGAFGVPADLAVLSITIEKRRDLDGTVS